MLALLLIQQILSVSSSLNSSNLKDRVTKPTLASDIDRCFTLLQIIITQITTIISSNQPCSRTLPISKERSHKHFLRMFLHQEVETVVATKNEEAREVVTSNELHHYKTWKKLLKLIRTEHSLIFIMHTFKIM